MPMKTINVAIEKFAFPKNAGSRAESRTSGTAPNIKDLRGALYREDQAKVSLRDMQKAIEQSHDGLL
jgi:hypothetical protein